MLEEKASAGERTIKGHYDAKKNVTRINEKVNGEEDSENKESKRILSGLAIISFSTDEGVVGIHY